MFQMVDTPNAKFSHVYAVLRFDFPVDTANPENTVTVVKVFESKAVAEAKVSRLNAINQEKGCIYKVHVSRLVVEWVQ